MSPSARESPQQRSHALKVRHIKKQNLPKSKKKKAGKKQKAALEARRWAESAS